MVSANDNSFFGEAIYSYSRAQAISDGVLVDLTQFEVTRQTWKMHVACTDTVWNLMEAAAADKTSTRCYTGLLHDIYTMARLAIMANKSPDRITFKVSIGGKTHTLKMVCGPGDTAEPVLTIMMPNED